MRVIEQVTDTLYYLGLPVIITHLCNEKGRYPNPGSGWVNARWPDGKVYTHWRAQLLDMPWGMR